MSNEHVPDPRIYATLEELDYRDVYGQLLYLQEHGRWEGGYAPQWWLTLMWALGSRSKHLPGRTSSDALEKDVFVLVWSFVASKAMAALAAYEGH